MASEDNFDTENHLKQKMDENREKSNGVAKMDEIQVWKKTFFEILENKNCAILVSASW